MSRKLLFFMGVFYFLLVFAGNTSADSLVAHWKFDETSGTTAADSSVNNNTGTLYNMDDSDWIAGKLGNALDFDGSNDYVQVADHNSISFGTGSFSISFWIKKDTFIGDGEILINGSSGGTGETGNRYEIGNTNSYGDGDPTPSGAIVFVIDHNDPSNKKFVTSDTTFVTGDWVHCVCIRDASVPRLYIYRNSVLDDDRLGHALDIDSAGEPLYFAQDEDGGQCFQGQLDDIRFYDYALSQNEIDALCRIDLNIAWDPDPANETWNISTTPTLSWSSGDSATSHDVYFGTSEAAVTAAGRLLADIIDDEWVNLLDFAVMAEQWSTDPGGSEPSADLDGNGYVDYVDLGILADEWLQTNDPEFKGNQAWADNTYNPSTLAENTTYYWRIDEVNNVEPNSPWTGAVWSFNTVSDGTFMISNINPADYTVQYNSLMSGQPIYTDRTYTFTNVASFAGETYIKTANNDKEATGSSFLTFTVNANAVVHVAHDDRIETKPSWLSYLTDIGENIITNCPANYSIYRKEFAAGTVVLGGNTGDVSSSMYSVIVVPAPTAPPTQASAPDPADSATGASITPSLNWAIGDGALSHDIYFGATNPPAFQCNQFGKPYMPGFLSSYTTYYWRINEKNSLGTTIGPVWSFTTGDESTANVLWANDDCAVRDGINYNNNDEFGLFVKYAADSSWIEFTFGSAPVSQAVLNLWLAEGGANLYDVVVRGAEYSFDETTFTGTSTSGWTVVGHMPVQTSPDLFTLDITSFYNNHLGETVTLQLHADVYPGGNGCFFADHEGTRLDCEPVHGPRIDLQ